MSDVIIVGGGPVGLFLACHLAQLGVEPVVLERSIGAATDSRAIGIHPPSVTRLRALGLDALLDEAVQVTHARVSSGRERLARLSLLDAGPVLTLPQARTERLLEARLRELAPNALRRGAEVTALTVDGEEAIAHSSRGPLRAPFVVGCDGKHSVVRDQLGGRLWRLPAGVRGGERFAMGDFRDYTTLGCEALIVLHDRGLVESFPLPGGMRRWVVERRRSWPCTSAHEISRIVGERAGWAPDPATCTMTSTFSVRQVVSSRLVAGPLIVAGDAAHVISPFGGQGMNLGWLDAWDLAPLLAGILRGALDPAPALAAWERRRRRLAVHAGLRAMFNGRVGRRTRATAVRNAAVGVALRLVPDRTASRFFTMHGLDPDPELSPPSAPTEANRAPTAHAS